VLHFKDISHYDQIIIRTKCCQLEQSAGVLNVKKKLGTVNAWSSSLNKGVKLSYFSEVREKFSSSIL